MEWIPLERRKRGRPRKTWVEGVQAAMTMDGVQAVMTMNEYKQS